MAASREPRVLGTSTAQDKPSRCRFGVASLCPDVILFSSPCTVVRSTFFFLSSAKARLVSLSFSDNFVVGFAFVTFVAMTAFCVFFKACYAFLSFIFAFSAT